MADAELGLGHYDAAIEQASMAIDAGYRTYFAYLNLAAAHAFKGEMDEAKTAHGRSSPPIPSSGPHRVAL